MVLAAREAYRLWAGTYDDGPNPLVALESRLVGGRLEPLIGRRILDVAAGTGRWMRYALTRGADAFGIDVCPEMLAQAATIPETAGRLLVANARDLPFAADTFDLAVCSFGISYFEDAASAVREMARVAGRVVISDMHPHAVQAGWKRGFRADGTAYTVETRAWSGSDLNRWARAAGLRAEWRLEGRFDEPELEIFRRAGRESTFEEVQRVPAVLVTGWVRR